MHTDQLPVVKAFKPLSFDLSVLPLPQKKIIGISLFMPFVLPLQLEALDWTAERNGG